MDAGYGTRDEHTGTIYLTVPGEIWTSMELVPVVPRDLWTLPTAKAAPIDPAATEGLTRIERIIARREAGTYRVR